MHLIKRKTIDEFLPSALLFLKQRFFINSQEDKL